MSNKREFLSQFSSLSVLLFSPSTGRALAILPAAWTSVTLKPEDVFAKTTSKASAARGKLILPLAVLFSSGLIFQVQETPDYTLCFSDANLDFLIWNPPTRGVAHPASASGILLSVLMLLATASIR